MQDASQYDALLAGAVALGYCPASDSNVSREAPAERILFDLEIGRAA
jgi:hypothetical protein